MLPVLPLYAYMCNDVQLIGIRGFYPPRIREELIWNRVANLRGGAGHNIELDLLNEHLNNEFKGANIFNILHHVHFWYLIAYILFRFCSLYLLCM